MIGTLKPSFLRWLYIQNDYKTAAYMPAATVFVVAGSQAVPEPLDLRLFMNKYTTDRADASFNRRATRSTPAKRY